MGQFSFYTADTKKPISCRRPQKIIMAFKDENGNIQQVIENGYRGYGDFGGIDIFEVLGTMNGITNETSIEPNNLRKFGIEVNMRQYVSKDERVRDIAIFGKNWAEWPQLFAKTPPEIIDFTNPLKQDTNQGC